MPSSRAPSRLGWYLVILLFASVLVPLNVIDARHDAERSKLMQQRYLLARQLDDQLMEMTSTFGVVSRSESFRKYLLDRLPLGSSVEIDGGMCIVTYNQFRFSRKLADRGSFWHQEDYRFPSATWQYVLGNVRESAWVIAAIVFSVLFLPSLTMRPRATRNSLLWLMLAISIFMYLTAASVQWSADNLFRFDEHQPTGWAALMGVLSILLIVLLNKDRVFRPKRVDTTPRCAACGYNLTGNTSLPGTPAADARSVVQTLLGDRHRIPCSRAGSSDVHPCLPDQLVRLALRPIPGLTSGQVRA